MSAIAICEPTVVALVMFLRYMMCAHHNQLGYVFACFRRYIKTAITATAKMPAAILMSNVVSIRCFLLSLNLQKKSQSCVPRVSLAWSEFPSGSNARAP